MLPFFKSKIGQPGGIATHVRTPDGGTKPEETDDNSGLNACAADLIRAVHAKDEPGTAAALRAAYEILDASDEPSDEEPTQEGQL